MRIEDLPEHMKTMNPHLFAEQERKADEYIQELITNPAASKVDTKLEKALQTACEGWLKLSGYYPRTPEWINNQPEELNGWYIHLSQTKRNPIILDLLIIDTNRSYLEIELKTMTGRASKEQAQIIATSNGCVVRDIESFQVALTAWEHAKNNRNLQGA